MHIVSLLVNIASLQYLSTFSTLICVENINVVSLLFQHLTLTSGKERESIFWGVEVPILGEKVGHFCALFLGIFVMGERGLIGGVPTCSCAPSLP